MPQAIWNSAAAVGKVSFRLSAQQHKILLIWFDFGHLGLALRKSSVVLFYFPDQTVILGT